MTFELVKKKLQLNLNFDFNTYFTLKQNAQKVQLKNLVALFVHFKFKCKFNCKLNFRNMTTDELGPGVMKWLLYQ